MVVRSDKGGFEITGGYKSKAIRKRDAFYRGLEISGILPERLGHVVHWQHTNILEILHCGVSRSFSILSHKVKVDLTQIDRMCHATIVIVKKQRSILSAPSSPLKKASKAHASSTYCISVPPIKFLTDAV